MWNRANKKITKFRFRLEVMEHLHPISLFCDRHWTSAYVIQATRIELKPLMNNSAPLALCNFNGIFAYVQFGTKVLTVSLSYLIPYQLKILIIYNQIISLDLKQKKHLKKKLTNCDTIVMIKNVIAWSST